MVEPLRRLWKFYPSEHVRFMCAWDTTSEDVEALAADIERLANG
jgi:threonine aldolase